MFRFAVLFAAVLAILALASSANAYDDRTLWKYKGNDSVKEICKKITKKCSTYKHAHPKGPGWYLGNTCQDDDYNKKHELLLTCESVKTSKSGKRLAKVDHISEIAKAFKLKRVS